jgi:uncharacterized protein (TIGR02996 family)
MLDDRAEELLQAIRAAPADDAPRLVFADHIATESPAHAAWIVAQCTGNDDPALLDAFRAELPEALRERIHTKRGFVETDRMQIEGRDFLDVHPDLLFRLAPFCTAITLQDAVRFDEIGRRMRRYDGLSVIGTHLPAADARALAQSPDLQHLLHFGIENTRIDDAILAELLRGFASLESLALDNGHPGFSFETFLAIRDAPFAGSLRTLELESCRFADLVEALRGLPNLRALTASGNPIDERFAALPHRFERLEINGCGIDDAVAGTLARAQVLSALRSLCAAGNPWTSEGIATVLASPNCGPLRVLRLAERAMENGQSVIAAVGRSPARATIEQFSMSGMQLGEPGVRALVESELPALWELSLINCDLGTDGVLALARAPFFTQLRWLVLDSRNFTERNVRDMAPLFGDATRVMLAGRISREIYEPLHARLGARLDATAD